MSFYSPPTENLPIFNSEVFENTTTTTNNVENGTPSGTIITFAGSPIPDGLIRYVIRCYVGGCEDCSFPKTGDYLFACRSYLHPREGA